MRTPGTSRESVGARIDRDREGVRLGPRAVEDIAAVARTYVDQYMAERGGQGRDLTDVDVHEALAGDASHA